MVKARKKRVVLLGGAGEIGAIIVEKLSQDFDLTIIDQAPRTSQSQANYIQLDATDYPKLLENMPKHVDAIVNLLALRPLPELVTAETMQAMSDVYIKAAYNIFLAASELGIKKVVFASSNHATSYYEDNGDSLLNREITTDDYPYSKSVYGALKIAGESLGKVFALQKDMRVVCLRIGAVHLDEATALQDIPRSRKTLLSQTDLAALFACAIEADVQFGIYYGVSDNQGKPWSIENAIHELGFQPIVNAQDIMQSGQSRSFAQRVANKLWLPLKRLLRV